jgi:protein-S-isoprenylcysteine O-methyltransferase Ste14
MKPKTKGWIYVAVQVIFIGGIVASSVAEKNYAHRQYSYITDFLAFLFLSLGALIGAISFINFGQMVTPNPVPMDSYKLKTNGLYSKIRHPIYLAALLILLGCIFFFAAFYTIILFAFAVGFIVVKIRFEEAELIKKFPEYTEYMKHTYKLIPFVF